MLALYHNVWYLLEELGNFFSSVKQKNNNSNKNVVGSGVIKVRNYSTD